MHSCWALLAVPGVLAAQAFKVEKFSTGGEGGTDYLTADPVTGRVYVSRGTDNYTVVSTVATMVGAKTIAVGDTHHIAYAFTPEYGPAPAGAPAPEPGRRGLRGPMVGTWFIHITH